MKRRHFVFIRPKQYRFGLVVIGCKQMIVTVASPVLQPSVRIRVNTRCTLERDEGGSVDGR